MPKNDSDAMLDYLPPYPAYKDSGVPWLGGIPAHWEVVKLRHILRRFTERNRSDLPLLSVVREKGVILRNTSSQDENRNYIPNGLSNYKVVRSGQFAINKMKAWQGSYGVSRFDGIVSPAYFVFNVSKVDGDFFHSAIRSRAYVPSFAQASDGVRIGQWDLSEPRMRETRFLIPPLPEQHAITRYLDHVDRRIRRYIRTKQRLIALLEEQKQAIIHQSVTGQLDVRTGQPYPAYKPSGVEWFADLPSHWKIVTLRNVCRQILDGPHVSPSYLDSGVMFISARNVKVDAWDFSSAKYISRADYEQFGRRMRPEKNDVLYTKGGTTGVARAVDFDEPFQVWVHVAVLKVLSELINPFFLAYALNSPRGYEQSQIYTRGATNQDLGLNRMARIQIALPPLDEQEAIVQNIDDQIQKIYEVFHGSSKEIALLREYRTRLIGDVVTGQVDVRAAAARLPGDFEEIDTLNEVEELAEDEEGEEQMDVEEETDG
jgi:type I restriction enzyme S subunit